MKVAELAGRDLAIWVARANGWPVGREDDDETMPLFTRDETDLPRSFTEHGYWPHEKWEQGGPIIERERIDTSFGNEPNTWEAFVRPRYRYESFDGCDGAAYGPSLLVAAMRAYVASKFGDEVPDDEASAT